MYLCGFTILNLEKFRRFALYEGHSNFKLNFSIKIFLQEVKAYFLTKSPNTATHFCLQYTNFRRRFLYENVKSLS